MQSNAVHNMACATEKEQKAVGRVHITITGSDGEQPPAHTYVLQHAHVAKPKGSIQGQNRMRREFEIRTPVSHTCVSEQVERFPLVELTV
jgi:hypothetical protein